jgi:PTH1 family peptidyl-tRNA hydrolase
MKLIVGLGNPGKKYADTRHNVGFAVAGLLARRFGQTKPRAKFRGEVVEANVGGERVLLLCPHTYMNRSGASVLAARDFFKIDDADLLIVCDDVNLPLAKLRCRARGSSGGQKGLADIIRCLGTQELARVRIGIGSPPDGWDVAAYVLSRFHADEIEPIQTAVERAANAAADWTREGIETCMNRYNADIGPSD